MSITISDILKFPSLKGAKVVAGHSNLQQSITSITVMESADEEGLGINFQGRARNYGHEIVITAFMACKDDIQKQCATLRRSQQEGQVGFIIFYVGSILPKIDENVIKLADEIEIPLIVMPENNLELRYSDVIVEVMEAIINDRKENTYFTTEVIERISHLEESQRTINAVLSIIRDQLQCSLFLYDEIGRSLNIAEWPHGRGLPAEKIYEQKKEIGKVHEISLQNNPFNVAWETIESKGSKIILMMVKEILKN